MNLDHDAVRTMAPYLVEGEQVLWAGRPQPGFYWSFKDTVFLAVGLIFMGFGGGMSFFLLNAAANDPLIYVGLLFPAIFFGMGFWAAFLRKLREDRALTASVYAITDRSVLLYASGKVLRLRPSDLREVSLEMHRNGSGTVQLQPDTTMRIRKGYIDRSTAEQYRDEVSEGARLWRIPDAAEVFRLLESAHGTR